MGDVYTFAGTGDAGFGGDGGPATAATLNSPRATRIDGAGDVLIADSGNSAIRKVSRATGVVTTLVNGSAAGVKSVMDLQVDAAGNMYFADYFAFCVRMVAAGTATVTTVVGTAGASGYTGDGGPATRALMGGTGSVAFDAAGNLYVSDRNHHVIRKVAVGTRVISTYAGTGTSGFAGDGGAATLAQFSTPVGLAWDPAGRYLYVAEAGNTRVRRIAASTTVVTTFAGTGTRGTSGDGGPASSASLVCGYAVAFDATGANAYLGVRLRVACRCARVRARGGLCEPVPLRTACLEPTRVPPLRACPAVWA